MSTLASLRNLNLEPPVPPRYSRWALIRAWLPTFLWIGVISFESTSIFTSEHTNHWLYVILNFLFGANIAAHAPVINAIGRKFGHFTGYSILGGLSFFGWTELLAFRAELHLASLGKVVKISRRWHLRAAVLGVLVVFAVAALDEFHQTMIPGRTGVFHDVILDTMGGVFAQILIFLFWKSGTKGQIKPRQVLETAGVGRP